MSDPLIGLPFDLHERYSLTRRITDLLWPERERPLRVLDVGGHSSPIKYLLPDDTVCIVDVKAPGTLTHLPIRYDQYVIGSGASLPFPDGAFDLVTAHDTLEHVPAHARESFLRELFRVAGGHVILNGPVYDPQTARVERVVARLQERLGLGENVFLGEHILMGLPERRTIEAHLGQAGVSWTSIPNGQLGVWLAGGVLKDLALALYPTGELTDLVDHVLNSSPTLRALGGRSYREAYVVAVTPKGSDGLQRVREGVPVLPRAEMEGFDQAINELEAFVRRAPVAPQLDRERELEARVAELETAYGRATAGTGHRLLEGVERAMGRIAPWGTRRRSLLLAPARATRLVMRRGWGSFLLHLIQPWKWVPRMWQRAMPPAERLTPQERYEMWLRLDVLAPKAIRRMRREAKRFTYRPEISVVMPVFDPQPAWLHAAIESVKRQAYPRWQLCIADDGSTREDVKRLLADEARKDSRIVLRTLDRNMGISAASNAALEMATGEFVGLLDHDDELKPNALYEVVRLLNQRRDLDYIYSDEDKKELDGSLTDAFFKPDWSPDFLMSVNYVTHFSVYRAEVLERVGGFRSEYDGSQDYDLALRVTESTDNIAHIPLPLYSWRKVPGSAAASLDFKDYAYVAGKKALEAALERRGYSGSVEHGIVEGRYRARYDIRDDPSVLVIIPTRDRRDLLERCVESIRSASTYPRYEIMIVDNDSREPETLEYLEQFPGRVFRYPREFNFAAMMNAAAQEAGDADMLLFLNNDTEVIAPEWIEALVEHGQRPEVAAVGARLVLPNGDPQHEGIVVGAEGAAAANVSLEYFGLGRTIRNCSAVTAACMMVRQEVFRELGGFEERLAVAFNDVDLCLRAREKGYEIVYTPYALLYHDEGSSRGFGGSQAVDDETFFRRRWRGYL
ncbi:MAG: glycosyltransferase, partial [Actinomycetota bacterium]